LQQCPEIYIEHGSYKGDCCTSGGSVIFYCEDSERYQLLGATSATCLANGSWSAPVPTCEETYCNDPGASIKGFRLVVFNNTKYNKKCCPPKTLISYGCNPNYQLEGERRIRCRVNGTWTHRRPTCRRKYAHDEKQRRETVVLFSR
ncbi:hypothetical protein V5799_012232, partial [Amblyomma americanum]